jgi:cobyrinic acid a,c-diamide synthase
MFKKGVVIAGLAGGSGKSVVAVGMVAALAGDGKKVVPFKKGPDYIDAGWLQLAAGSRCYNLDPYLMSGEAILQSFEENSAGADIVLVEGNRGLYDGVNAEGGYSTAELAVTLDLPVLLVVNCTKTTRTVAAMVMGCRLFDKRVDIRGVILNQIATERQRLLICSAVEQYTDVPVLGSIPRLKEDIFPMRHLGMVPHQEYNDSSGAISRLAALVQDNVDLQRVVQIMKPVRTRSIRNRQGAEGTDRAGVRIGVLQDAAFQFYYTENLEALQDAGADLVYINAMRDAALPDIDGLYIGGGFPETSARELAANESFRSSVKEGVEAGLPVYAECGGLIYLGRSILIDGEEFHLVDVFPIQFGMSKKPQAHGYSIFSVEKQNPFYQPGAEVKGHEFRYSTVLGWHGSEDQLAVRMLRGKGFRGGRDGLVHKNVFALYTHIHAGGTPQWAVNFVKCCMENKLSRTYLKT